ncbi:MAG: glycosyltransferase [Ferruginibacter sp.]
MKVLHLIKSLGRGGAEMLLQETLKLHNKDVFEFHYIYFLPWKNQMVDGLEQAGGTVVNFSASNNVTILLQIPKIIRYIKKNNIELIHCHLPWAGFAGRIVYLLTRKPVIYSEHNIQDRYHMLTRILNRLTFNWQKRVIAVSGDVEKSIQQHIRPTIPVQSILNGVNTNAFRRNEAVRKQQRSALNVSDQDVLIITIAVFRFQKRLKEWIDLIRLVQADKPHVKACIVGDGLLKEDIMEHVRATGMEDKIIFAGLQTDVIPWLSAADIFMMTSAFEGLPIALLEAMSMECAIVTTNAGGIKEVIRNEQDGLVESVDNWKDLRHHLIRLIENPEQRIAFGLKARQRVVDEFSMQKMVNQLETCYLSFE